MSQSLRTVQPSFPPFTPAAPAPFATGLATRRRVGGAFTSARSDVGAIDVLAARYPVIRRLVGDESFRAVARQFIAGEPPRSTAVLDHGETFPRFLRSRGNAASIEYVADIAELELACGKARRAADARPVGARAFSPLSIKRLKGLRVELHPSVFLVASRFPIVTIWENNQGDAEPAIIGRWRAEAALVARPFMEVEVRRLSPGGHAFIAALAEGRTMATAVEAGMAATTSAREALGRSRPSSRAMRLRPYDFDVARNLVTLIEAEIVVGFRESA